MSWPMVSFIDVCNIQGGTQPPKSTFIEEEKPGYIRLLQIQDFKRADKAVYIPYKKTLKTCAESDILIGRYGASVGKILTGLKGAYNVALVKTLPNLEKLNTRYLYHFLCSPIFQSYILNVGSRAAQAGFNKEDLAGLEIPLPPLAEQKRIAAILDKADAIRRKRQQAIQLADDFLRAVFLEMFGDPVTNPKGWETKTIEQIISEEKYALKRGPFGGALKKEIFVDEGYLVYEQYHALNGDFSYQRYFIDETKFQELKAFEVKPKDIIVSCSGVNLGRLAEVPSGSPSGIINQALMKITLNQSVMLNELFIDIFSNPSFKTAFYGDFRGAAIPNFPPMATFREFRFIVPPLELQQKYVCIKDKLSVHSDNSKNMDNLDLFNALSQKAFSGQL